MVCFLIKIKNFPERTTESRGFLLNVYILPWCIESRSFDNGIGGAEL